MEYKRDVLGEKVLPFGISKESWIDILKDGELIGLKDMKILLDLYSNYGQPMKRDLIGEGLEFRDIDLRIQGMGKRIAKKLSLVLNEEEIGSFKHKFRYWFILLEGKEIVEEGTCYRYFAWSLKKELKEAIDILLCK